MQSALQWGEAEAVIERCTASGQLNNLHVISLGKISKIISFATLNPSIPLIRDQKGSRQNIEGIRGNCRGYPGTDF